MELDKAMREGPSYLRNAEDSLQRNITNPELIYMWDNQVAVIDAFLADTEPIVGESGELDELRTKLRDAKKQLERKVMEFEASQEGEEVPDDPPEEELVEDFKAFAPEILGMADEAIKSGVSDVEQLASLEDPRSLTNGFLADSEPYAADAELAKVRSEVRERKMKLDEMIKSIEEAWRQADLAAGS